MIPWWTNQQAGLLGAIGGSVIGIVGGVFGTIAGTCVPRGKAKPFLYGFMALMLVVGAVGLVMGLAALAIHQPYAVWYPLLLAGGILLACFGVALPVLRLGYRQADVRKFEAESLRRG
jgi:hypothetical protein